MSRRYVKKETGKGKAKHKFGDYLMDVSKYVLTAVVINMFFNDIAMSRLTSYAIGVVVSAVTLIWGIIYYKYY